MGFRVSGAKQTQRQATVPPPTGRLVKGVRLTIAIVAAVGLASPFGLLVKAPVVDLAPILLKPPVFLYEPPAEIVSAKVGELQADIIKKLTGIQSSCPVAMSPDGKLIAFGTSENAKSVIAVYDLHRFIQISSLAVPDFPAGTLAWSPDQKSIACTIGGGGSRRIWILNIAKQSATELPRPPGRDVPGGDLHWWQKDELAFFPDDEAFLAFDLDTLLFLPLVKSPHYTKLDSTLQQRWAQAPRIDWPQQSGWKLGLRELVTSAVPPPRRNPESPWDMSGHTICAYVHPELPLAYGISDLSVILGDRILCSPDGSKIARVRDDEILVTYMKKVARPDTLIEVEMPRSVEQLEGDGWKSRVESKELCVLICAPMTNPLNHEVVGADYKRVHAIARLHEWQGRKATFILPTFDGKIRLDDVAVTLHSWTANNMSEWKAPRTENWWAPIRNIVPSAAPDKMTEIDTPHVLDLQQEPTSLLVTKAVAKPRPVPVPKVIETSTAALLSPAPSLSSGPFPLSMPLVTPAPPAPPAVSDNDARAFLAEHHAKASRGDVTGMIADYDATVDFLNKGRIPVTTIEAEERAQRQKWPKGHEQVVGVIHVSEDGGVWSAAYTIEFSNENAAGDWHKGRADLMLNMRSEGTKLYITSQKAKVYDVTESKAPVPKAPPAAPSSPTAKAAPPPKSATISVPRPCFITTTRPRDTPQFEFTDQISFVKGIVWHRTYRELSADGKVLRACRAIYEGSGGVSQDRSTARIRVGIQGWDQDFGDGLFTGVCSKNAASLVGKTFQFQFVTGGMVESQLGMVFQLQQ